MSSDGTASKAKVLIGDRESSYESFVVQRDIGQPDAAQVVLSGQEPELAMSAKVEIEYGGKSLYVGEVVSASATYREDLFVSCEVKAMNRFHRLNRGRRSEIFQNNLTEKDLIKEVLERSKADIGLADDWEKDYPNYGAQDSKSRKGRVVHWSNQTAMEFLAMRAARYGFHVWCVNDQVYYRMPALAKESEFALVRKSTFSKNKSKTSLTLRSFSARMSSSEIVEKVTVRATDPDQGDVIVAHASLAKEPSSSLGQEHAVKACKDSGTKETFILDVPVASPEEANAVANAEFVRRSLTFITADAVVDCNPELQLGTVVEVVASDDENDPFCGGYYVMGLTHRFTLQDNKAKSYETHLRLARDAQKAKG